MYSLTKPICIKHDFINKHRLEVGSWVLLSIEPRIFFFFNNKPTIQYMKHCGEIVQVLVVLPLLSLETKIVVHKYIHSHNTHLHITSIYF